MSKNVTLTLKEAEIENLDNLVEFFQSKSVGTVTRTDVVKFLVTKFHSILDEHSDESNDLDHSEFFEWVGIKINFVVD